MRLEEIKQLYTTLNIDPDEARILAAVCHIAALHCEGSEPVINPLAQFGSLEMMAVLLDGYTAMFEAAGMAGAAHNALSTRDAKDLSLSAIRTGGTGSRFLHEKSGESEARDDA